MIKLDQYTPYIGIKKAIKDMFNGDLFLRIDKIEFSFFNDSSDDIINLDPDYYTIIGQYGRINSGGLDFYRDFSIGLQFNYNEDEIKATFYQYLTNEELTPVDLKEENQSKSI